MSGFTRVPHRWRCWWWCWRCVGREGEIKNLVGLPSQFHLPSYDFLLRIKANSYLSSSVQPTVTNTASPATQTSFAFDTAGCPGIDQDRYNSTTPGKHFLRSCYMDAVSQPTQNIIMGNKTVANFNDCLDSCAKLDGCLAATWVMFSFSAPRNNAVCFFKNSVGNTTPQVAGDSLVTGFLVA